MTEVVRLAWPDAGEAELAAVGEVLATGQLTMGPRVREFEGLLERACDVRHAVAVSSGTAALHLARTVSRRAERLVAALAEAEPINPDALKYLNRLSDHLFVLSRAANQPAGDLLWQPGINR